MEMEWSSTVTVTLILENLKKVNFMAKVVTNGMMADIMKGNSSKGKSMVKESGLSLEMTQPQIRMREVTNSTKRMDLVLLNGNLVILIKEILYKT